MPAGGSPRGSVSSAAPSCAEPQGRRRDRALAGADPPADRVGVLDPQGHPLPRAPLRPHDRGTLRAGWRPRPRPCRLRSTTGPVVRAAPGRLRRLSAWNQPSRWVWLSGRAYFESCFKGSIAPTSPLSTARLALACARPFIASASWWIRARRRAGTAMYSQQPNQPEPTRPKKRHPEAVSRGQPGTAGLYWARASARTADSNRRSPSFDPVRGSTACSGCGIRPTTLPRSLRTPAMSLSEPFGFWPAA